MKQGAVLFFALLLFVFLAAVPMLAQEQPDLRTITIRSSEVNNGVVILAAREGKSSFELHCNQGISFCAVPEPGNYLMLRLPKNRGVYQCANVELYRTTTGSELGDRIGQYCLVEEK
jgi:hypothetical protein